MRPFSINQGLITERARMIQDAKLLERLAKEVKRARLNNYDGYVGNGKINIGAGCTVTHCSAETPIVLLEKDNKIIKKIIIRELSKTSKKYRDAVKSMGNALRFSDFAL